MVSRTEQIAPRSTVTFVVPQGAVYEVADHIADVRDRKRRLDLASIWVEAVASATKEVPGRPFLLRPSMDFAEVILQLTSWVEELRISPPQRKDKGDMGVTDWSTVAVARAIKDQHGNPTVYIFSKDRNLKRREPDAEPEPCYGGRQTG